MQTAATNINDYESKDTKNKRIIQMGVKVKHTGPTIDVITRKVQVVINSTVPNEVKRDAIRFFKDSFTNQGFTNSGFTPWTARKNERQRVMLGGFKKFKKSDKESRNILVKTGALRRSIFGKVFGKRIYIQSDSTYAEIHNEGGMAGRNKSAKIPRRKFIGESMMINKQIEAICYREIRKCFR